MNKKAVRERRRAKRRKKRLKNGLIVGISVVGALAFLGFMVWNAVRPAAGEQVSIVANAGDHVPAGADPGPFNSDPPHRAAITRSPWMLVSTRRAILKHRLLTRRGISCILWSTVTLSSGMTVTN